MRESIGKLREKTEQGFWAERELAAKETREKAERKGAGHWVMAKKI